MSQLDIEACYENQAVDFAVAFTGEVHPVADLFPMMTDDELDDLAADIKANGLIHPIVLDAEGRLIDGRNRLAGCQRAGVEPSFSALNGHDPVAFILSTNVSRRHMTKSQLAMVIASAECCNLQHSGGVRQTAGLHGIDPARLSEALLVVENEPEYATAVIAGAMPFHQAVGKTRQRVAERSVDLDQAEKYRRRLEALRMAAPDLGTRVDEGLDIDEAEAALSERKRKEEQQIRAISDNLGTGLLSLDPGNGEPRKAAEQWLKADPRYLGTKSDFSAQRARRVASALLHYAELKESSTDGRSD